MRVLELSLRNYRVFEEVELELPARVIGIFGENGAGKTSLLESIAFALYGVDAARTKKQHIRTHGILTDCEVRLAFEHAGRSYEVRRSIRGKGHMPEAELYAGDLQLAVGTTDVDAEVKRLLHMDLHVFRSSVYAEQKQLDAFSSLRPGERKETALRLLGIKPVDDARTAARREARAAKEDAGQLADAVGDLAALEADLKDAKEAAAEATRLAKAAAAELREATSAEKARRKAFVAVDATRERVQRLTERLTIKSEQRDGIAEQREVLEVRVRELAEAIAELPDLEERLRSLDAADDRLRAAERLSDAVARAAAVEVEFEAVPEVDVEAVAGALAAAEADLAEARSTEAEWRAARDHGRTQLAEASERLDRAADADPSQPCPTCGRPLGEDFAGYVKHCKAVVSDAKRALASAERAAKEAATALARVERATRAATDADRRTRRAAEARAHIGERLEALRREVIALAEPFGGEVPDVDELRARADEARALGTRIAELGADRRHLEAAEKDLAAAGERLEALEGELATLAKEAEGLAFDPDEHERLAEELQESEEALEAARAAEREASDERKDAEARVAEVSGALRQAKEIAERVDELRSEARYVERVAMLLDGFRDHLVARVGPELSREAETLFRELTNHAYDDLRVDEETLSIQIADGDTYFPVGRFSGSETDLANLALRVAISTHLSRVSGADVGMLVLDEVLASLDEERKDLMVQTLGRLAARFHQLFVITHAERVKDQFPATILVRKTGRRRSAAVLV
jgi:exonuclease SbcC